MSHSFSISRDRILRLGNFTLDCKVHEKVSKHSFLDSKSRTLYQPWATNLLPTEIDRVKRREFDINRRDCYYIGSIYDENLQAAQMFANSCGASGIRLNHLWKTSDEQNFSLTRDSLISIDFRGRHHINVGYLPCRIFKSISYGVPIVTNSRTVFDELQLPAIHFCEDPSRSLVEGIHFESTIKDDDMNFSILEIRNNHTFINRIENLLGVMFR